jgi:hypothetical protein
VIATTFVSPYQSGLHELPRMTERERDALVAAIDAGELVPVVDLQPQDGAAIVAVVAPEHVERFCAESGELVERLAELRDELDTLSQIVREVMAETRPGDFVSRIENCIDDAREILSHAENAAEEI